MGLRDFVRVLGGVTTYVELTCDGECRAFLRALGVDAGANARVALGPGVARAVVGGVEVLITNGRLVVRDGDEVIMDNVVRRDTSPFDPCGVIITPIARARCVERIRPVKDLVTAGLLLIGRALGLGPDQPL